MTEVEGRMNRAQRILGSETPLSKMVGVYHYTWYPSLHILCTHIMNEPKGKW